MAVKWINKGSGTLADAVKKLKANVGDPYLLVGILEGSKYPDGMPVAQVAYWQEFGTARIPSRDAIRATVREKYSAWLKDVGLYLKHTGILNQKDAMSRAFDALGQRARDDIRYTINNSWGAALKESTIRAKRRAHLARPEWTLVWTGEYQKAVDYVVKNA